MPAAPWGGGVPPCLQWASAREPHNNNNHKNCAIIAPRQASWTRAMRGVESRDEEVAYNVELVRRALLEVSRCVFGKTIAWRTEGNGCCVTST